MAGEIAAFYVLLWHGSFPEVAPLSAADQTGAMHSGAHATGRDTQQQTLAKVQSQVTAY